VAEAAEPRQQLVGLELDHDVGLDRQVGDRWAAGEPADGAGELGCPASCTGNSAAPERTESGMGNEEAVTLAAAELVRANGAVATARRALTAAVVGAYRAGIPLARIAECSGITPVGLRNLLDAAGEPRRRR